ncbi:hypothetical protein Tco_1040326, partial [Tanacetum coccineum]
MFAATTPENTPMAYRASTLANPNPLISPAFVEANYEALESLLRDRHRQMHNNDLRTELEYFSKDYNEEREMEPRPEPTRAATPPLRVASPRIRRQGERTVGFKRDQSRGESRVERNTEGGRPSAEAPRGNGGQSVNLPPLLAAHLGRGENGQPLQSSLTSAYGGQALPNNIGGNLPSNGFVHGLRTRSLVEHLSTDLPSTYKGLMEKTYTLVEAREEILATEKAARSFKPSPKMFRSKRLKDMSKYCHFHEDYGHDTDDRRHLKT